MLAHQGKKEGKTRIISLDINAADVFANVLFQLVTFNDSDAMSQSQIKSELPEAESVCSTESVGQPINSTRRCAVFVDPRATDTAYRLNYHIIWTQAVVIRLCEVIRPAHCLTLLSPQRLILIS